MAIWKRCCLYDRLREGGNMPASKANQRAVNKYVKNNYDRINVTFPKGQKDLIQAHAAAFGESVNGFIGRAVSETMERDNKGGKQNGG